MDSDNYNFKQISNMLSIYSVVKFSFHLIETVFEQIKTYVFGTPWSKVIDVCFTDSFFNHFSNPLPLQQQAGILSSSKSLHKIVQQQWIFCAITISCLL